VTLEEDDPTAWSVALCQIVGAELGLPPEQLARVAPLIAARIAPWMSAAAAGRHAARVAHEVRNPLAVIATSASLIAARAVHEPAVLRHTQRIAQQTAIAAALMGQLLASAGPRGPSLEAIALATVVEDACEGAPLSAGRLLARHVEPGWVRADRGWTRQILVNLLRNADEASEGRGEVRVRATVDGVWGRIRVEDDGPGVPPALRTELFREGVGRGHGIGLALARGLARGQGGELVLVPTDAGATFELSLPMEPSG
jgi:signal transduction histidine kinase